MSAGGIEMSAAWTRSPLLAMTRCRNALFQYPERFVNHVTLVLAE